MELLEVKEVTPLPITKGEKYRLVGRFGVPTATSTAAATIAAAGEWKELELELYRTEAGQATLTKVKTLATSSSAAASAPTTTTTSTTATTTATTTTTTGTTTTTTTTTPEDGGGVGGKFMPTGKSRGHVVPKPHVNLIAALIMFFHAGKQDGGVLVFLPGIQEIRDVEWALRKYDRIRELWVLKLHSSLPPAEQRKVFQPPPVAGLRKVVLSTNIAESSVTVDDIVFVIDSGLMKEKHYSADSNVASLDCQFVSQVNVVQRRGRAGRVREGVCVHLFPHPYYSSLVEFPIPELCRSPLEEVCLQLKAIGVKDVSRFIQKAMSPPSDASVRNAMELLRTIQAVADTETMEITILGQALAKLPIHPQLARMVIYAGLLGVLHPVATVAAILTVRSPFVIPIDADAQRTLKQTRAELLKGGVGEQRFDVVATPGGAGGVGIVSHAYGGGGLACVSDHWVGLAAVKAWESAPNRAAYAESHCMSHVTLSSIRSTRDQVIPLVCRALGVFGMAGSSAGPGGPALTSFADRHAAHSALATAVVAMSLYPNLAVGMPPPPAAAAASAAGAASSASVKYRSPDGHVTAPGRDSVTLPYTLQAGVELLAYYERIAFRGTLLMQDCSVVGSGGLPYLLTCRQVSAAPAAAAGASTASSLEFDDLLRVSCGSAVEGIALRQLRRVFDGILFEALKEANFSRVPGSVLDAIAALLEAYGVIPWDPTRTSAAAAAAAANSSSSSKSNVAV